MGSLPLYGGTFARLYSVSKESSRNVKTIFNQHLSTLFDDLRGGSSHRANMTKFVKNVQRIFEPTLCDNFRAAPTFWPLFGRPPSQKVALHLSHHLCPPGLPCSAPQIQLLRRGPKGASHKRFHAAPSKKQACFLEGSLTLRNKGKRTFLEPPVASFCAAWNFHGLPPFAPILIANPPLKTVKSLIGSLNLSVLRRLRLRSACVGLHLLKRVF